LLLFLEKIKSSSSDQWKFFSFCYDLNTMATAAAAAEEQKLSSEMNSLEKKLLNNKKNKPTKCNLLRLEKNISIIIRR